MYFQYPFICRPEQGSLLFYFVYFMLYHESDIVVLDLIIPHFPVVLENPYVIKEPINT